MGKPVRMGERIGWLDTARAIGIVAVVAGHVTSDRAIWAAVFHFHMPLFFMLSGMTFAPGAVFDVARRRVRTLLVPYVLWLALVAGADVVIAAVSGYAAFLPWERPVVAIARLVLGGTFLVGPMGIFWFATCLFVVQLAAVPIVRRPDRQIVLAAAVLLGVIHLVRHWPSPWGVISVPIGLFFFLAGVLHRRHAARLGWRVTVVAVVGAALVAVSAPLDLKIADYGTPLLSIVAALGSCHLVLLVAQRVPPSRIAGVIGRASLVIMYVHLTIFYAVREWLPEGIVATLAIALPIALWLALRRFAATRVLLLGERADPHVRHEAPVPR